MHSAQRGQAGPYLPYVVPQRSLLTFKAVVTGLLTTGVPQRPSPTDQISEFGLQLQLGVFEKDPRPKEATPFWR